MHAIKWGEVRWAGMAEDRNKTGILLFAHGSRVEEANRGVHDLARKVQEAGEVSYVRAAFLEMARPDLAAAIAEAVRAGYERIVVIPYFLTLGIHLRRDFPELLARERRLYPAIEIEAGAPLEGHPLLPALILDQIRAFRQTPKAAS
ncbi:MAG: sirohydrochlorin chelatase [Terriglobia bacterium]